MSASYQHIAVYLDVHIKRDAHITLKIRSEHFLAAWFLLIRAGKDHARSFKDLKIRPDTGSVAFFYLRNAVEYNSVNSNSLGDRLNNPYSLSIKNPINIPHIPKLTRKHQFRFIQLQAFAQII